MARNKWIQASRKKMEDKGTVGSLTRIANRRGQTPAEYCSAQKARGWSSKKIQKKCQWMININK